MNDWLRHVIDYIIASLEAHWNGWLPYLIGCGFAIGIGHIATRRLVDRLWVSIGDSPLQWESRSGWWLPKIVGLVERALYVGSMKFGHPEFLGVWLALKVAANWSAWKKGIEVGNRDLSGSSIFSIFLIGNGVSIGYAVVGFYLISEVRKSVATSIVVILAISAATVGLWYMAKRYQEQVIDEKPTEEKCIPEGPVPTSRKIKTKPDPPKCKTCAVLLAVFLGFVTWLYTYKHDAWKFWTNLVLTTLIFYAVGGWICITIIVIAWFWAIIDSSRKSQDYYHNFPPED
jgi:hypothetical protein